MEEIFAEFVVAIYDLMRKCEENVIFSLSFMEKIYKNRTRLKLSKMKNTQCFGSKTLQK